MNRKMLSIAERDAVNTWLRQNIDFCKEHTLGQITQAVNFHCPVTAKPSQITASIKALKIEYRPHKQTDPQAKKLRATAEIPCYVKDIAKMLLGIDGQLTPDQLLDARTSMRILTGELFK